MKEKIAYWFFYRFKPWFIEISNGIGVLTTYILLAFIISFVPFYLFERDFIYSFFASFFIVIFLSFGLRDWSKKKIIKKEIVEIIEESEESVNYFKNENNTIDSNKTVAIIITKLGERGLFNLGNGFERDEETSYMLQYIREQTKIAVEDLRRKLNN